MDKEIIVQTFTLLELISVHPSLNHDVILKIFKREGQFPMEITTPEVLG